MIRDWWKQWPNANIGIATGSLSGIDVLDIDPRNGGSDSLLELEQRYGRLPQTIVSLTGGGGRHYLFRHDPKVNKNSTSAIADGIDLKTGGGYIVAPPSLHRSGVRYSWEGPSLQDALFLAVFPEWLLELIVQRRGAQKPRETPNREFQHGERNNILMSLAGTMRSRGMSQQAIGVALIEENRQKCAPPLGVDEVHRIAKSVARYRPASGVVGIHSNGFVTEGYDSPLNAILDVIRYAADLREFRALLFHIERSLGYGKSADRASISQMVAGIFSQEHGWIRKGCGLKKAAAVRANATLVRIGLLTARRRSSPENGNEPTEYEVNWPALSRFIAERKREALYPLVYIRDKPCPPKRHTESHLEGVGGRAGECFVKGVSVSSRDAVLLPGVSALRNGGATAADRDLGDTRSCSASPDECRPSMALWQALLRT